MKKSPYVIKVGAEEQSKPLHERELDYLRLVLGIIYEHLGSKAGVFPHEFMNRAFLEKYLHFLKFGRYSPVTYRCVRRRYA